MRRSQALAQLGRLLPWAPGPAAGGGAAACGSRLLFDSAACGSRLLSTSSLLDSAAATGPPAFVFDIDGVLVQGRHTLPQAKRALARLYTPDGSQPLYPLAFMTNGGGVTERFKAHQLSEYLGVHVHESQVVLSHTPFRQLAQKYADLPVLISGRGQVRDVARRYGFKHVVTTHQLTRAMPAAVPFHEDQGLFPGSDLPSYTRELKYGSEEHPIRAALIFTDPSDWYRDLQLLSDVVLCRGVPGRWPPPPDAPHVEVYFSNPDLLWANEFSAPRYGQGAFFACLDTLHMKVTGEPLPHVHHFGKPHPAPYLLTEQLLLRQAQRLGVEGAQAAAQAAAAAGEVVVAGGGSSSGDGGGEARHVARTPLPFSAIYAVGDNPMADVRGANAAGSPWVSVLVTKTGVARENCDKDPAQIVVDDVEAAVEAVLHRVRASKWHSMR